MFLEIGVTSVGIWILLRNQVVKYYAKYFAYYGITTVASFLLIPFFASRPKNVLNLV